MTLTACLAVTYAVERYEIARRAHLVVVASLDNVNSWPWIDGWHFSADLKVAETVWGQTPKGKTLPYRFICSCCPKWRRPDLLQFKGVVGLWFLDVAKEGVRSSGGCADPGYRPLALLEEMRTFLHTRSQPGLSPK